MSPFEFSGSLKKASLNSSTFFAYLFSFSAVHQSVAGQQRRNSVRPLFVCFFFCLRLLLFLFTTWPILSRVILKWTGRGLATHKMLWPSSKSPSPSRPIRKYAVCSFCFRYKDSCDMSSMICPVSLFSRVVNRDEADAGISILFHCKI